MGFNVSLKFDPKKLEKTLGHLYKSDRALKLGILEGATNADTDANIAEYAFYNEYGTEIKVKNDKGEEEKKTRIPARPFMRNTMDEKSSDWAQIIANELKGNVTTQGVVERALGQVGIKGKADIQQTIESNQFEANAQSTVKAKKKKGGKRGNIPLKDSMDMFNAIDYEVTDSKGKSL